MQCGGRGVCSGMYIVVDSKETLREDELRSSRAAYTGRGEAMISCQIHVDFVLSGSLLGICEAEYTCNLPEPGRVKSASELRSHPPSAFTIISRLVFPSYKAYRILFRSHHLSKDCLQG